LTNRVVIVGGGRTGRELAGRLAARGQVLLLEIRPEDVENPGRIRDPQDDMSDLAGRNGVFLVRGDGTSRLVLQALYDPHASCALVAAAGIDEINLEVCRLGQGVGYQPIVAVQHDSRRTAEYRAARITALDQAQLMADHAQRSLHHRGAVVPVGIGLGRGELVEIRLLPTSPLLDRPLKHVAPHRWRVAAVFRDEELLVPTGETRLQVDDRVLLVGDPAVLATMAEHLRLGRPQFPRPFGPNVVTLELSGTDGALYGEADGLACATSALNLVRGTPEAPNHAPFAEDDPLAPPPCDGVVERLTFDVKQPGHPDFLKALAQQRPGVVLVRPWEQRPWWARLLGLSGQDSVLCDLCNAPVLFSRGTFPYKRILLPVSSSTLNLRAAEAAIDLSRQLGASLTAMNVDLPLFISGEDPEQAHFEVVPIRRLCELYDLKLEYVHRVGNPIENLVEESKRHDLVVVFRRHGRRDSFFNPDVALEMVRRVDCSVLVITVRPEA
jgi:Trk K+ transport system NAD-binding subunit/nucleotide-binding universal stress UspA family protein